MHDQFWRHDYGFVNTLQKFKKKLVIISKTMFMKSTLLKVFITSGNNSC